MKMPVRATAWVSLFAVAFGLVEAAVVVYLRGLYYPEGFAFPLKLIEQPHLVVELARELCTIIMLIAVGIVAGSSRWQKFAYFMLAFGVWDIFYYVWLKIFLNWPVSLTDWDILFLIPLPWVAPVIAPILISIVMIIAALRIVHFETAGNRFSPPFVSWILGGLGTGAILFTFLRDTKATLGGGTPESYAYGFFGVGVLLYLGALYTGFRNFREKEG